MFMLVYLGLANAECLRVRNFKFSCIFHPSRALLIHQDSRYNSLLDTVVRLRAEELALRPCSDFSSLLPLRLSCCPWSCHPLGNKSGRI